MFIKLVGIVRAFLLRPFFGKIGMISYICRPTALYNPKGIFISKNVRIYPGVRMETHNNGKIIIEEDVSIGQNFHITASGENPVKIGKKTTVLGNVFVTNIDHEYRQIGVHILRQPFIEKKTEIGENCFIGYGACIQAGTILGKQCVVGANSVVRGIYPDYCVIVGAPAKVVKQYNPEKKHWEKTEYTGCEESQKNGMNETYTMRDKKKNERHLERDWGGGNIS